VKRVRQPDTAAGAEDLDRGLSAQGRILDRADLGDEVIKRLAGLQVLDRVVERERGLGRVEAGRREQVEQPDPVVDVHVEGVELWCEGLERRLVVCDRDAVLLMAHDELVHDRAGVGRSEVPGIEDALERRDFGRGVVARDARELQELLGRRRGRVARQAE